MKFSEISIKQVQSKIIDLYDTYSLKLRKSSSEIISIIADELDVSEGEVMQVLQFREDKISRYRRHFREASKLARADKLAINNFLQHEAFSGVKINSDGEKLIKGYRPFEKLAMWKRDKIILLGDPDSDIMEAVVDFVSSSVSPRIIANLEEYE